jgi:ribonuclease P protein component
MDRSDRITNPRDFKRVRREGKSYAHPLLVLITGPNQLGHNRYGITTSRSLARAVDRNRAKRRLRHALQAVQSQGRPGRDHILIARPGLLAASWDELLLALSELFERAETA